MIDVQALLKQLDECTTLDECESFHKENLAKKGLLAQAFANLKNASPEEKKTLWQMLSHAKKSLQEAYDAKIHYFTVQEINKELANDVVDITVDGETHQVGYYGLLAKTRRQIESLCQQMWFVVEYGHDVVSKYENFEAVNIPLTHPATEMHDTIYMNDVDERGENFVLRTHTTAIQNGMFKKYGVPLKAVMAGKVYRYEDLDASHDTVFYQLDGIVVDKWISIAHFKDFMTKLLSWIFEFDVKIRMRPAYFPFVEPGFEIDATCPICQWKWCNLCKKTGWIEILGAWMIHPNVLREGGIDPNEYSWFAFGIGINRVVAIKYGIKDIRYFTNGDLRFVRSFA